MTSVPCPLSSPLLFSSSWTLYRKKTNVLKSLSTNFVPLSWLCDSNSSPLWEDEDDDPAPPSSTTPRIETVKTYNNQVMGWTPTSLGYTSTSDLQTEARASSLCFRGREHGLRRRAGWLADWHAGEAGRHDLVNCPSLAWLVGL